jgi:hypothetical protein
LFLTISLALSGDPGSTPNELLSVASAGGITRVMITGNPSGSSLTLDDLNFTPVTTPAPVPEPSTLILLVSGLFGRSAGEACDDFPYRYRDGSLR